MAKFMRLNSKDAVAEEYAFICPGCNTPHWIRVGGQRPLWQWNNDINRPTVSPALLVFPNNQHLRCHSFITDGEMIFLGDCWHDLKGQTVAIPEWNDA